MCRGVETPPMMSAAVEIDYERVGLKGCRKITALGARRAERFPVHWTPGTGSADWTPGPRSSAARAKARASKL